MGRGQGAVPLALIAGGIALVAWAVASGEATLYLLVVVPVITGSSPALLGGVALVLAGFLTLPWAFRPDAEDPPPAANGTRTRGAASSPSIAGGGVILIGPVPIFFGAGRPRGWWVYVLAALGGALLLVTVVLFFGLGGR